MTIDNQLLSTLSSRAKASPRLRQNYDLRNSESDNSQRMLNALEPGTILFESKTGACEPLAEGDIMFIHWVLTIFKNNVNLMS